MKASYKKLWKLLVDKEMSKGDLHKASGLSSSTMTKLRKGEDVSMEALRKICICLDCNIGDIVYGLGGFGLKINERVPLEIPPQKYDLKYMRTKQEKMGHIFKAINL